MSILENTNHNLDAIVCSLQCHLTPKQKQSYAPHCIMLLIFIYHKSFLTIQSLFMYQQLFDIIWTMIFF